MRNEQEKLETAVLGCGCFWCTEAIFKSLRGVTSVMPGYAGGEKKNPTYEEVSTGNTNYAEVAKIMFDPDEITYAGLLEVFFALHNPTTKNRQGNDVGSQYRSVIFYANDDQKYKAEKMIRKLVKEKAFDDPIVTEVVPLGRFYPAENYHQNYFRTHQDAPYCQFVISPKLVKLRQKFSKFVKDEENNR